MCPTHQVPRDQQPLQLQLQLQCQRQQHRPRASMQPRSPTAPRRQSVPARHPHDPKGERGRPNLPRHLIQPLTLHQCPRINLEEKCGTIHHTLELRRTCRHRLQKQIMSIRRLCPSNTPFSTPRRPMLWADGSTHLALAPPATQPYPHISIHTLQMETVQVKVPHRKRQR